MRRNGERRPKHHACSDGDVYKKNWTPIRRVILFALVTLTLIPSGRIPAHAQENQPARVEIFLTEDTQAEQAKIYFMDPLSGLSTVISVEGGEQFTLVGNYVMYAKTRTGAIMKANPDGTIEPHPFIHRAVDARSLRWVVSPDGQAVAWVQVSQGGVSQAYVAWADGRDARQLPISTPDASLELFPLALSNSMTEFFYDAAHPSTPPPGTPYVVYSHIAEYNLLEESFAPLAQEPDCPCGAAVSAEGRIFARLEAAQGTGPFTLHVWDLPTGADIRIPPPDLVFPYAGDLILNSTETLAVYSAAAGLTPEQYTLVLVDMVAQTQTPILTPGPDRYLPLAFIDGDSALMLAGVTTGGTYKLDLASGELRRVSKELYLGTIITGR